MAHFTASIVETQSPVLNAPIAQPVRFASAGDSTADSLRRWLMLCCLATGTLAAWVGNPSGFLQVDPELAFLMRGMAGIKATLVSAALGLLWWRFNYPTSQLIAMAYVIGVGLASGATVLIWQLSFIPLAAIAFHAGEFLLLLAAWRDQAGQPGLRSYLRYSKT